MFLENDTKDQINAEHAQLLALINNMTDGFIAIDQTGKITLSNSVALSLLDTNVLEGTHLLNVIDIIDKNGYPIDIQKLILDAKSSISSREWQLRYKDDTTISVQINISPVRLGYGKQTNGGFVVLLRDISAEKKTEEERDEFISVAGHELRTPVTIAEGSISNARTIAERDKASDPVKHSLNAAYDQIMFLSSLVNDLSMLTRADSGKAVQSLETFAPLEFVESLVRDYQAQATDKKLSLQQKVQSGIQVLTTNRLYVHEIIQNYITNALKYTEKGSIVLGASTEENGVLFTVTDTGIGIGINEQPKLFTKFFRSDDWRVRRVSGTGLGLYVSMKLAKLIGAKLEVKSEINKGSTFMLHVPNLESAD